ncbi:MAG: SPFH domain-containing protein [Candidatus Sumerlaeia bacterium]|nr:SPFH domain-containing protein [Candidatus Sumerlaeia bacterium]
MVFGFLRGQLIDIIEWNETSQSNVLCWRFPRADNEIKNGAQLIVREGQRAILVDRGRVADTFEPGQHRLTTQNIPILSRLQGWAYGFESPFKCEVYFVSTKRFTNQKWGTANPIMMRDKEFGMVRVRSYGSYAIQVSDSVVFLRQLVATDPSFEVYEIAEQLRNLIVTRFSDAAASSGLPVLDMAANLDELSKYAQKKLEEDFREMGLSLPIFLVENVSLPPEVEAVMDKRTSMGIVGNLDQYMKFQAASALEKAAGQPAGDGGAAGLGASFGLGMGMAGQMANLMGAAMQPQPGAPASGAASWPPPPPMETAYHVAVNGQTAGPFGMAELRARVERGELTRETYVWKAGMANWIRAQEAPELAALFGAPPLPG